METKRLHDDFENADTAEERRELLGQVDLTWDLPDEDLQHYYVVDPEVVREYVDDQIEMFARWDDVPNTRKFRAFLRDYDPEYADALFRKTCYPDEWKEKVEGLSASMSGESLIRELERIHPLTHDGFPGAAVFERLYREHGDAIASYVRKHIGEPWENSGWESLLGLLEEREAWDLWDGAVSGQASQQFDTYVHRILEQADERPTWARERLNNIAGASYVTWGGRRTARLGDRMARDVYRRFPNVLKSILDEHVHVDFINPRDHGYEQLAEELQRVEDWAYFDRLASKFLSKSIHVWGDTNHYQSVFLPYIAHYRQLDDDAKYCDRALRVLSAFQPDDEQTWFGLRKNNPLYSFFFEHPGRFAARPELVTDLLESSFFSVRSLGYRTLVTLDEQTGQLAADNAHLVLAAPLDRLSSRGMRAALSSIDAMVEHDLSLAGVAVNRLREAASLAYPTFSKGALVRTIGIILRRQPELRRPSEQPDIHDYGQPQGGQW